jgi:hypothetical protein
MVRCSNCGRKTEGDYCQWCGYPVLTGGSKRLEMSQAKGENKTSPLLVECPNCHRKSGGDYCVWCGHPLPTSVYEETEKSRVYEGVEKSKVRESDKMKSVARTVLIVCGVLILYGLIFINDYEIYWFLWSVGMVAVLWGCFLWCQLKNRAWGFMFWGLLAPIGLLGIACLKDKSY